MHWIRSEGLAFFPIHGVAYSPLLKTLKRRQGRTPPCSHGKRTTDGGLVNAEIGGRLDIAL